MPTKKSAKQIEEDLGYVVQVSPQASVRDVRACKKLWSGYVDSVTEGHYTGEIQGYQNHTGVAEGPDGGEPMNSGDMRDTWTLCVVDEDAEIVWWEAFLPWVDDDSDYYTELAEEVHKGDLSYAEAKKILQSHADHAGEIELQSWLDAGGGEIPAQFCGGGNTMRKE